MNPELCIRPTAPTEWHVTLGQRTLCTAETMDDAITFANAYTDGWRAAVSAMPLLSGPMVDWQAVREHGRAR